MKFRRSALKSIIFITIFIFTFSTSSKLLSRKWDEYPKINSFYALPKNSIDVIFFGTSTFDLGISPLQMWEDFGFTSYNRAIPGQEIVVTYYYLLESLNYQNPKVIVLNPYKLFSFDEFHEAEASYRRSIEPLKLSLLKIQLSARITLENDINEFLNLLFQLIRYHSRWSELSQDDFTFYLNNKYDPFRGQRINFESTEINLQEDFSHYTTEKANYNNDSLYYYDKIIELCKRENIQLILLALPRTNWFDYSQYLAVKDYADSNDLIFIDYSIPEFINEVNFDPSIEFKNKNHLNTLGAKKFSYPIGSLIIQNYNLVDKRTDPNYQQWNQDANLLLELISENHK